MTPPVFSALGFAYTLLLHRAGRFGRFVISSVEEGRCKGMKVSHPRAQHYQWRRKLRNLERTERTGSVVGLGECQSQAVLERVSRKLEVLDNCLPLAVAVKREYEFSKFQLEAL